MKNFQSFYKNKKVLVTGHTGFKGTWLSIWLKQLGADVIGIALDPKTDRDLFLLAGIKEKIIDYREDIRNLNGLYKIVQKENPQIIFHLAAQSLVLPSYKDPLTTFETNIIGTANILEVCRNTDSVKQIIIVTTDKVYENKERLTGYRENDPLGGYDPYSASKAAAEIVSQSFNNSFNQSVATVRAGNVIGGGDWSVNRIVPDCIRSLEKSEPIIIRHPESVRPWQHVLESLSGYLLLASKMAGDPQKYSGAWNFGPEIIEVVSVKELVKILVLNWGKGKWEVGTNENNFHEAGCLLLDISKSKNILGWKPILEFEEAIKWTVEWYKNYVKSDVYDLCASQIERYTERWSSRNKK